MKEIVFNKKEYKSFKDFYHDVCIKLRKNRFIDWRDDYDDLGYSGDLLNEFLWYCHDDSNKYIFINFDLEEIKNKMTFDNYKWRIILKVFSEHVQEFPNNQIEFRDEEK